MDPTDNRVCASDFSLRVSDDIHIVQITHNENTICIAVAFALFIAVYRRTFRFLKTEICHISVFLILRQRCIALAVDIWGLVYHTDSVCPASAVNTETDDVLFVAIKEPIVQHHSLQKLFHRLVVIAYLRLDYYTMLQILPYLTLCSGCKTVLSAISSV